MTSFFKRHAPVIPNVEREIFLGKQKIVPRATKVPHLRKGYTCGRSLTCGRAGFGMTSFFKRHAPVISNVEREIFWESKIVLRA
jgi:hypothetical protein